MLAWTALDGALPGYVAARVGRRAPLPSAPAVGIAWAGVMVVAQSEAAPAWFGAANVVALAAAVVAPGAFRACRVGARAAPSAE